MSVRIKEMVMPDCCVLCELRQCVSRKYTGFDECGYLRVPILDGSIRPDWCPLEEVED